jgi:hypothetical protein
VTGGRARPSTRSRSIGQFSAWCPPRSGFSEHSPGIVTSISRRVPTTCELDHTPCDLFGACGLGILSEAAERAVHRCNQPRELIDTDTVLRDITTDDLRNQARINPCLSG